MTAILSCRNLVKSFASEPPLIVLDHLSADFHENEICAITGMSGKGKSTLLAILGGTAKPDSGTVDFMGKQYPSLRHWLHHSRPILVPSAYGARELTIRS